MHSNRHVAKCEFKRGLLVVVKYKIKDNANT